MQSLLAGWVAGYAVSMVFTVAGIFLVLERRRTRPAPTGVEPPTAKVGVASLAVILSTGGFVAWTLVGLVAGAAYEATRDQSAGGVGESTLTFAAFVAVFCFVVASGVCMLLQRVAWQVVLVAISAAACFGLLVPVLAER
jgi:hypothetical protein